MKKVGKALPSEQC